MRITGGVMIDNMLRHLQKNIKKLDDLNQQLATGKKFQLPSDNPTGVTTTMEIKDILKGTNQYIRNIDQAMTWLSNSESALNNAGNILNRARELAVYGSNDSLSPDDRQAIAQEIGELRKELINLANTRLGDRYLFSGLKTDTAPFTDTGSMVTGVVFNGDTNKISREIGPGIDMEIGQDGNKIFKNAIDSLQALEESLKNGSGATVGSISISGIDEAISRLDDAINQNLESRAEIGAKINRLELAKNRLGDEVFQSRKLLSKNEDVDIAEVVTELKMQESVYRASLAVGARIMQPSLVDFLR